MDLGGWLRSLGLEQYEAVFRAHAIDSDVFSELSEGDLEKLSIPLGDRKRLIKAIRALVATSPGHFAAEAGGDGVRRDGGAERRHLTVMICDLVGSTALSARLDPEDMRTVIDAYHAACARIIPTYDGFLAEFRGDGILAYFGYPRAHEDDAERTVRAGLEVIAAVAALKTRAGEPLAVRIGIATGLVIVGNLNARGALREHAVVGDTPNLAARLLALAEPGSLVIAASTRRLLGDLFRLLDLGQHEVKGFAEPVAAWRVEGLSASESRFDAARVSGLADVIGRHKEIDFLLERQRLAWKGEGQIVLISGEPGIGKSRIAAALEQRIAGVPHMLLRYQCSPYHTDSALRPIITQLERAAGFKADDTSEQRLDKLELLLASAASRVQAATPLFAAMLSIPFGARYPPLALSPAQQRRKTLAALLDRFESLARQQPIVLLFEDAHYADATSLELLDLTIERVRQLPVLVLLTFRPEFEPSWVGLPNVSSLTLDRLDRSDVESMVGRMTGGYRLPAEVMKQIVVKTDGNPLFVEELTKAVLEADILIKDAEGYRLAGPLPPLAIPATLQDSLMARLDRLAPVREISQIGAAIGREFSYSLVRAVVGWEDAALQDALGQLEHAELIFRRGEPPDATYSFKHALVRDAAYETLLKTRRQQLHGQIGRTLEERFADVVASQPEIVAHHFTEAGLVEPAIDYWLKSGKLALSRSANAEAVKHLRRGLELTQSQTTSDMRIRKELDFLLALGPATSATEGYAAPEALGVFLRARDLLGDGGTPTEQMTVLWGIYLVHSNRAEHTAARDIAQRCLSLATQYNHPGMLALATQFMGQTRWMMGAFVDARIHLERSLEVCAANPEMITSYRRFGADDEVTASSALSRTLLILGYPDQAAAVASRSLDRARALGLAFTTAFALDNEALFGILGADPQRATAHANEALTHSIEHCLAEFEHRARFVQGALLAQSGNAKQGIEFMRSAIGAIERTDTQNRRPLYLGHTAVAHASLGQPEVGLGLLDEAIQATETTNERFFEAEMHRLRGEMLLQVGKTDQAEAGLRRAVEIAQQQSAHWWELRAATSLARHLHQSGYPLEAYSLLQPVYSWYTEGFDTNTLQEAKTLLDELQNLSGTQAQLAVGER